MARNIFERLRRLLTVPTDDIDLVRAQFRAFAKQIPLLYFILATNTVALVSIYAKFGHLWITLYAPAGLCAICVWRSIKWWRIGRSDAPDSMIISCMRTTNKLAFVIAVAFTAWGMSLFSFGDAYARSQVVFFLGLTMISCIFCLMHLRPAALMVGFVGVVPFSIFFFFADHGHFRAAAVNLAFVAVGMIAILVIYYRDFANLVASRRALIDKQAETQRLSDDNLRLANEDSLSGLPNRRALVSRLNEVQADRRRGAAPTAVVFVDLDGFKDVNDTYGHETGDQLIQVVADMLKQRTPSEAILARLGGDEFAILLSADDAKGLALAFANSVVEALRDPIFIGARPIKVGASVGIAYAAPGECDAQELFRQADIAMYNVKSNGKSGTRVYSPDLDAERRLQQECEEGIRRGLVGEEFEVFYQPIVDAASKAIVAVEALLRWPRRAGSEIGPDQFIKVAETSGLIHPLGLFVLRRACRDLREIDAIRLCINISPAQFRDPSFETKVAEILAQSAFPADRLELELTEGYLIDHPERASAAISSLKKMGIAVALDDFGVGYSSIAYLQRYGFDRIKIDKSLAASITTDKKAAILITGAVYLATGLEMTVTAEGVETEEQERMLRLAGCQYLQGYRYCVPKSIGDLMANELSHLRPASRRSARARV
jgi:diguanylate cyclase (GGDEF)-like protein